MLVDAREGVDLVVEHDCHGAATLLSGEDRPLAGTLVIHAHRHDLSLHVVELAAGLHHDVAVEGGLAVDGLEGDQIEVLSALVHCLHFPSEFEVVGQDGLGQRAVDDFVDAGGVGHVDDAGDCHRLVDGAQVEHLGEVGLLCGGGLCHGGAIGGGNGGAVGERRCALRFDGGGIGHGGLGSLEAGGGTLAQGEQRAADFALVIGFIEFEVGSALEQFAHALRLLDTREFEQNAARALEFLDVGSDHTEAVDTVAQHLVGIVDHRLDFLLEDALDL